MPRIHASPHVSTARAADFVIRVREHNKQRIGHYLVTIDLRCLTGGARTGNLAPA